MRIDVTSLDIRTRRLRWVKWTCGVVLLATFFMPLSRCYYVKPITPQAPMVQQEEVERAAVDVYAYRNFKASSPSSWAMLLAFTWPLLLLGVVTVRPRTERIFMPMEPLACIASGSVLYRLLDADRVLPAGWLALLALSVYCLVALLQYFARVREDYLRHGGLPGP